jgi:hypothetical protein
MIDIKESFLEDNEKSYIENIENKEEENGPTVNNYVEDINTDDNNDINN